MTAVGAAGAGRGRRRWLLAVAAVSLVAVAAATTGVVLYRASGSPPAASPCAVPSAPPPGAVGPADRAPDGGGLRVAETGFTQLSGDGYTVSAGAVLENTSSQYAYRARVTIDVLDRGGRSASSRGGHAFEVPVILPGQRLAFGDWTQVRQAPGRPPVTVAAVDLELGAARWVPADQGRDIFAEVTASLSRVERSTIGPNTATIFYSVDSGYCREVVLRGVAFVFRDAAGRIVGGSFEPNAVDRECVPGTSDGLASADRSTPPVIDERKMEIALYCDIGPDLWPALVPVGP
jgi:hypothetical protein